MRRVKTGASLAAAIVAIAVLAPAARAGDSPGLALAKKAVEETRGDEHREKMRIVWPEIGDETPPEGAEVTLISGYIDYQLTRLVWRGGKVDVTSVATARTWFYNKEGESYRASIFDVDAAVFAATWAAARHVLAAHDERIEPEPREHGDDSGSYGSGSHESRQWIRLRLAGAKSAFHVSDSPRMRWNWERVHEWAGIQDGAVFLLFEPLVASRVARTELPLASCLPPVLDEIHRASVRMDLSHRGEHGLLLEVCLRVAGETGNSETLDAVEALDTALSEQRGDAYVADDLREEAGIARTKLRLTARWDSAEAARVIRENPHQKHWQEDLAKWVRRRFREKDLDGYTTLLIRDTARKGADPEDVKTALAELRGLRPEDRAAALARLLSDADPDVRVVAACAALDTHPADAKASATLLTIADDRAIAAPAYGIHVAWCRIDALEAAAKRGLLGPDELRARLRDPRPEHGYMVEALIEALRKTSEPASDDEARAAWRRVVDGAVELGVRHGVIALFNLHDVAFADRIAAAIDRMEAAMKASAPGSDDLDAAFLERLRQGLAELRGEPAPAGK
jgi:hypothetical protein